MTGYLTFLTQDCLRYKERTRNMALFNISDNIFWLWSTLCWIWRPQVDVISASHQTPSASSTAHLQLDPTKDLKSWARRSTWVKIFLEDNTPSTLSTWGPKYFARQQFHDDFFSHRKPHTDKDWENYGFSIVIPVILFVILLILDKYI